jgi:hypothetical protein
MTPRAASRGRVGDALLGEAEQKTEEATFGSMSVRIKLRASAHRLTRFLQSQ